MNVDLKSINQAQIKKLPKSRVTDVSVTSVPGLPGRCRGAGDKCEFALCRRCEGKFHLVQLICHFVTSCNGSPFVCNEKELSKASIKMPPNLLPTSEGE